MALNQSIDNFAQRQQLSGPLGQIVLLAVVIVLFSWFLVKPAYSAYSQKHTELKGAQQQLANIEKDKADLDRLASQLHNSETDVKITDEALPLNGRITKLDVLIDTLAKSSGLQVAQIDSQDTADRISAGNQEAIKDPFGASRSLQTTKVTVFVAGTVDQFRNFLQLLETSGRILDVSDMDITTADNGVRFRVTLKAYAYDTSTPN